MCIRDRLYRGLDFEGDILEHPDYLEEAYQAGRELVRTIREAGPKAGTTQ